MPSNKLRIPVSLPRAFQVLDAVHDFLLLLRDLIYRGFFSLTYDTYPRCEMIASGTNGDMGGEQERIHPFFYSVSHRRKGFGDADPMSMVGSREFLRVSSSSSSSSSNLPELSKSLATSYVEPSPASSPSTSASTFSGTSEPQWWWCQTAEASRLVVMRRPRKELSPGHTAECTMGAVCEGSQQCGLCNPINAMALQCPHQPLLSVDRRPAAAQSGHEEVSKGTFPDAASSLPPMRDKARTDPDQGAWVPFSAAVSSRLEAHFCQRRSKQWIPEVNVRMPRDMETSLVINLERLTMVETSTDTTHRLIRQVLRGGPQQLLFYKMARLVEALSCNHSLSMLGMSPVTAAPVTVTVFSVPFPGT